MNTSINQHSTNLTVPRELQKWFDKLDLAYSITNIKRDLANGFVVAEILSRYYTKDVNIYKFYNGLKMSKRRDNWERVAAILNKYGMKPHVNERDFEPVMFLAKGAAFNFVCRLYEFITQKDLKYKADIEEQQMPYHLKPTASLLMKNTELTRIVNADEKLRKNLEVLQGHYFNSKNDKQNLELDKFIIRQRQKILEQNAKRLFSSRKSKKAPEPAQSETKFIVLRGLEGNKKKNEKNAPIMESRGVVENLNAFTLNCLDKEENREIMKDIQLPKDHVFVSMMQNTYEYPPEFLQNLFEYLNMNISDIVEGLANSYTDFKNFMSLIVQFLENIEPNTTLYAAFFTFTCNVGVALVAEEPDSTCVFMESAGLEILTDFASRFSNKKDALAHLIYFFTVHDSATRYRIVKRLKEILSHNWKVFIPFLANLGIYPVTDNYDEKLFNFNWFYALLAIDNSCPKIKAAGLKIINEISSVNTATVLSIVKKLKRLSNDSWWEIKTQILIICANLLMSLADDDEIHDSNENSKKDGEDARGSQDIVQEGVVDNAENDSRIEAQKNEAQDKEELIELKKSLQESLMSIILDNFKVNANVNVQKVGLIYLAQILKKFPDLCSRYLSVLLKISQEIRDTVLNIDLYNDADSHIVLSTTSFKYKQTGAPLDWNSVGIAQALNSYVKAEKLERFETVHIDILAGCLINELNPVEKDTWLQIYQDLQKYIFVSLAAPELCHTASVIVKKFFMCPFLQETIMQNTYNLFLRILELVYEADIDQSCKDNMLS